MDQRSLRFEGRNGTYGQALRLTTSDQAANLFHHRLGLLAIALDLGFVVRTSHEPNLCHGGKPSGPNRREHAQPIVVEMAVRPSDDLRLAAKVLVEESRRVSASFCKRQQ